MTLRLTLTGLIAGLALPAVFAIDANADHRSHWFFDSYNQYEAESFNYYAPPRRKLRRRRPIVVYEDPLFPGDDILEDEYYQQRKAKRRNRWRDRRIRYDLTRKRRQRLVNVPLPRSKPLYRAGPLEDDDDSVTTATISRSSTLRDPKPAAKPASKPAAAPAVKRAKGPISCKQAEEIVAGFGFSDVKATSCKGKSYDFAAKRDGKPFNIKLSAASGELTEVKRN